MIAKDYILVGRFEHKVDARRRVRLPAPWYDMMGEPKQVIVMVDPEEKCLDLVPVETMEARMKVLRRKSVNDPAILRAFTVLAKNMEKIEVDSQHFIRISDRMLDFAGIRQRVVFSGSALTAKLWNPTALRKFESVIDPLYDEIMKESRKAKKRVPRHC